MEYRSDPPVRPLWSAREGRGVAALILRHAAAVAAAIALACGPAAGADDRTTVVELFTSQGCSSCPPADALLGELAEEPGVIALSLHVDYWDGAGWSDPFGSAVHTRRQRAYARTLDDGNAYTSGVYTPQMVIDGRHAAVGHAADRVRTAIAAAAERPDALAPRFTDPGAVIVPRARGLEPAVVWLLEYDDRHATQVAGGENGGRTLVNRRVVRDIRRLGAWHGEHGRYAIDAAAARERGRDGLVVLVQAGGNGPILGAAEHRLGR